MQGRVFLAIFEVIKETHKPALRDLFYGNDVIINYPLPITHYQLLIALVPGAPPQLFGHHHCFLAGGKCRELVEKLQLLRICDRAL